MLEIDYCAEDASMLMKLELSQLIIKHVTNVCMNVCVCTQMGGIGKHYTCKHVGVHMHPCTYTHLHVNIKRVRCNMTAIKKSLCGRRLKSSLFHSLLIAFTVYPSTNNISLSASISSFLSFPVYLAQTWLSISNILSQSVRHSIYP